MVYEIYTNHGYIYVSEDKSNHKIDVVKSNSIVDFSKSSKEQSQEVLIPVMQQHTKNF